MEVYHQPSADCLVELWEVAGMSERATIQHTLVKRVFIDPDTKQVIEWEPLVEYAGRLPYRDGLASKMVTTGIVTHINSKGVSRSTGRGRCTDHSMDRLALRLHPRSEEHTSELQSRPHLVCRLLLEKKNNSTRQSADG